MLISTTLDRGDAVSPSVAERSQLKQARSRDCSGWRVVSGGQEIGRCQPGGEGSRPLGVRARLG